MTTKAQIEEMLRAAQGQVFRVESLEVSSPKSETRASIQAAADDTEKPKGDIEKKLPARFKQTAYTGGIARLGWFGNSVFDLAGMELPERLAMLRQHKSDCISGHADKINIADGKSLELEGPIYLDMPDGEMVAKALKNGFPMQASVGLLIVKAKYIEKEETIDVNGQEMPGPFFLVSKSKLIESSFVVNGADDQTMSIAAARGNLPSEDVMAKEDAQTETNRAAEISSITAEFSDNPAFALEQINKGATLAEAKAAYADVLKAELAAQNEKHKAELEAARSAAQTQSVRAGRSYSDPIASAGAAEGSEACPIETWNSLVSQKMNAGMRRKDAVRAASLENPTVHAKYVAQANSGVSFSEMRLRARR